MHVVLCRAYWFAMNANQVKSYALALALSSTSTFIMGCDTENIEDGDVADLSENAQSVVDAMKLAGYEFLGTGTEKAEASDIDEDVRVFSFEHAQSGEGVDMLFSTNQDQEQTEPILRPWTGADEERLAALGDESLIEEADEFRGSWYYTGCSYIQNVGFNFGCINLTSNPA
ncbi:MAG: hypothetical protein KC457_10665, partial [Myxococcales bacterium]|nr:hypothetical protein [Myxococcales bacterium]